ncbi:LIM domain only protein 7b [Diretmus argenteus]
MEWRRQTSTSCVDAFSEAQRWVEEVTKKSFGSNDFRAALENGVLLCDLINQLKPGLIKRMNRLSTPIAGLDNVNVFLKACEKLGLNESQLFHPGDLQDLSTRVTLRREESKRRLKNVLITIYWLGRKAQLDPFYSGPQLNFKAFEGLLGLALSKALDEGSIVCVKHSGYTERCHPEREKLQSMRPAYRREDSVDSIDSLDSRALRTGSEGCGSDAEAEQGFRMEDTQLSAQQNKAYVPLLWRKPGRGDNGRDCPSPLTSINADAPLSLQPHHPLLSPPECAIDKEFFLRALRKEEEDSEDDETEADPVLDDLYVRRMQQTHHQTSLNPNFDRFLPRYWTPEEDIRVRKIYLGSQRRPWYHKMQGLRACQIQVRPGRPPQVNPGWIWSKSLSEIPMLYSVHKVPARNTVVDVGKDIDAAMEWKLEHPQKSRAKDGEAKWHDDLTKWKIRRRSTNSDLRRKLQEREHVMNQMTNGASLGGNGTQGRLPKRDQQSTSSHNPAPSSSSTSPTSKSSCSDLRPHTRALLARSYTTETLFSPPAPYSPYNLAHTEGPLVGAMPASDPTILGEETHCVFLASDGVTTPSLESPFSSQTQVKSQASPTPLQLISRLGQPGNVLTHQLSSPVTTTLPNEILAVTCTNDFTAAVTNSPISVMTSGPGHQELSSCMDPKVPTCHHGLINQATEDALKDLSHQNHKSQEEAQQRSRQVVVEHSRGQQGTGLYRYSSRTASWSGSATLPRGYRRSEGSSRLSVITARPFGTKPSRVSSLPRLYGVDDNKSLVYHEEDGSLQPTRPTLSRQFATTQLRVQHQASIKQNSGNQDAKDNGETQREEGRHASRSFQTNGHHNLPYAQTQLLPQPYSSLQSHPNKSMTLPSNLVIDPPEVHYSDMRVSLSLKPNSRTDFGFQTHWDSTGAKVKSIQLASPAELCQLCVGDDIVAVDGVAVAHMSYDQWKNTMTSALQTGCLTMDIRRYGNKDWSTSGGSHHNQPYQSRKTLNLTAAGSMLIGCPDQHANNAVSTETMAVKSSQFNGQAVNMKLSPSQGIECKGVDGEFTDNPRITSSKGSAGFSSWVYLCGGSDSAISDLQVPSLSPSLSSWSWDHEEERRRQERWQEEQERLLQEQYQRDQVRLEAEWQRAQQDAMVEEYTQPEGKVQVYSSIKWPPQTDKSAVLNECFIDPGDQRKRKGQSASKAEQDRQQILEEMKKRTQLLTDNSWIRQQSSIMYKEPIYTGVPLKRYDSLDNIHTSWHQSLFSTSTASYSQPHSAAAGYSEPKRGNSEPSRSCSPRYSVGANLSQKQAPLTMDLSRASPSYFTPGDESAGQSLTWSQQCGRLVSGRRTCCVCQRALGRGAAMVIEALSLCFHLACFQCVDCCRHLRGTETGVKVRIQNRKPYCEPCYFQLKL